MRRRRHGQTDSGRRISGAIVERITSSVTQRQGVIRLDKRDMTFWAVDGNERTSPYFESKNGKEVTSWLRERLNHTTEADRLVWQPVIEVKVSDGDSYYGRNDDADDDRSETIEIEAKRYYLAMTKDNREWRKLEWPQCDSESGTAIAENDRAAQSEFYDIGPEHEDLKPGAQPSYGERKKPFVLPRFVKDGESIVHYTPVLWEGLIATIEQLRDARKTIKKLLATKTGLALVAKTGAARLPLRLTATVSES